MWQGLNPPVLIFVQTKDRAQQLFQELIYDGINVDVIHAGRTQQQVGLFASYVKKSVNWNTNMPKDYANWSKELGNRGLIWTSRINFPQFDFLLAVNSNFMQGQISYLI